MGKMSSRYVLNLECTIQSQTSSLITNKIEIQESKYIMLLTNLTKPLFIEIFSSKDKIESYLEYIQSCMKLYLL